MNNPFPLVSDSAWEEMLTPEERLNEVASILARGVLRIMSKDKTCTSNILNISSRSGKTKPLSLGQTDGFMSLSGE